MSEVNPFAKVTIDGSIPVLAGIAIALSEHCIVEAGATLTKVSGGIWRLAVEISPEFTVDEDALAEWFTNVRATGAIDIFEPIDDHSPDGGE